MANWGCFNHIASKHQHTAPAHWTIDACVCAVCVRSKGLKYVSLIWRGWIKWINIAMSWKFVDTISSSMIMIESDSMRYNYMETELLSPPWIGWVCVCVLNVRLYSVPYVQQGRHHRPPISTHIWLYLSELNVSEVIILSNEALKWFSILPFIRPFISLMWCQTNRISIPTIPKW